MEAWIYLWVYLYLYMGLELYLQLYIGLCMSAEIYLWLKNYIVTIFCLSYIEF